MPAFSETELAKIDEITNGKRKHIAIEKVLALRKKGLSYSEIGSIVGCSRQNIHLRLADHLDDIDALSDFKEQRADLLALYQRKFLNSLTPSDIQKASAYQRVGMTALLHQQERLERGETTANIGYADYSKSLAQVMKEREKLAAELGIEDTTEDSDTITEP